MKHHSTRTLATIKKMQLLYTIKASLDSLPSELVYSNKNNNRTFSRYFASIQMDKNYMTDSDLRRLAIHIPEKMCTISSFTSK